jgi:hypothetical protein
MANSLDIDMEIGRTQAPRRRTAPLTSAREGRAVVDADVASRPALPPADRVGDTVEAVGRQVGRAYGYARSRTTAEMRADAERAIVDNPMLALAAALGLGFVVGRLVRR